ncbi:hypothetical protein P7C70_g3611, partial [Phenoliferia sp. Uapishka_3]
MRGPDEVVVISDSSSASDSDIEIIDAPPLHPQTQLQVPLRAKAARKSAAPANAIASGSGLPKHFPPHASNLVQNTFGRKRPVGSRLKRLGAEPSPSGTPTVEYSNAEERVESFNFARLIEINIEALDLSSFRTSLPSELRCDVHISITSIDAMPTTIQLMEPSFFYRSKTTSTLFERDPHSAPFKLDLPPSHEIPYPESLQIDIRISSPSFSQHASTSQLSTQTSASDLEAQYDFAVGGVFLPKGSSSTTHGRGKDRDKIQLSWWSCSGSFGGGGGGKEVVNSGTARGILESSLRSIEENARRQSVEDLLDLASADLTDPPLGFVQPGFIPTPTPRRRPRGQPAPRWFARPDYDHINWVPRAIPLEVGHVETYPALHWERLNEPITEGSFKTLADEVQALRNTFKDLGIEADALEPEARRQAEERNLDEYVDTTIFNPSGRAVVRRNFLALRALLLSSGLSTAYLCQVKWETKGLEDLKNGSKDDKDLARILDVYEARVGDTVDGIIYEHSLMSSEKLIVGHDIFLAAAGKLNARDNRPYEIDSYTCGNLSMTLLLGRSTAIFRSSIPGAGMGLMLLEPAKKGDLLHVYAGEWIGGDVNLRHAHDHRNPDVSYQFTVDQDDIVDTVHTGNHARFINAGQDLPEYASASLARDPRFQNCKAKAVHVHGTHQMGLYALRDLDVGTELLFNYGPGYQPNWNAN